MQQDEEVKKPKILLSKQITEALKGNGKFTYYENISYQIHNNSRTFSRENFYYNKVYQYDDEDLAIRMSYVLSSVHELGHANKQMLLGWLRRKKKNFPDKLIPAAGTDAANNERILTNLLTSLCKNGLLMAHDYRTEDDHIIVIYTCTYYGYIFYRNKLEMYSTFDSNSVFHTSIDSFKRFAANALTTSFASMEECSSVSANGHYGQSKKNESVEGYTYGVCGFFGNTDQAQALIIEPVFLRYNKKIMTEGELVSKIYKRLRLLEKTFKSVEEQYNCPVRVAFVIENITGLRRLYEIAVETQSVIFKNAIYTSENTMYSLGYDLNSCFVEPYITEKGIFSLKPLKDHWLM